MIEQLTTETFDETISASPVYVVKFYTKWCPDCVRTDQGYKELSQSLAEKARFGQVDADAQPDLAQRFDIRGIPTLLVFREGKEADRLHSRDAKTKQQLDDFLTKAL
ncbi:thioredoxin family protein [Heliobacterium chlorum]|uniref:Thioredoxin family protein n=1 Tax=Heliobacterium chlorum TaxID=2698 RepID=A0ABR7T5V8_HELCL|nr:thioredoxin family protein [Heliobacterium chlorum]MBC9785467.1 thioredoxin family protein [Heliobacterium chlorum]